MKMEHMMTREGIVYTSRISDNQCGEVGLKAYKYLLRLTTDDKLDRDGFVIDHKDVHQIISNFVENEAGSCEEISQQLVKAIHALCENYEVNVKAIELEFGPVKGDAFMTTRWRNENVNEVLEIANEKSSEELQLLREARELENLI